MEILLIGPVRLRHPVKHGAFTFCMQGVLLRTRGSLIWSEYWGSLEIAVFYETEVSFLSFVVSCKIKGCISVHLVALLHKTSVADA